MSELRFIVPDEVMGTIAERAAEVVLAQLAAPRAEPWPEWMSVETAARYLDVSEERVRKLKDARRVPFHQEGPGCRVFFKRTDLDEWLHTLRHEGRHGGEA